MREVERSEIEIVVLSWAWRGEVKAKRRRRVLLVVGKRAIFAGIVCICEDMG